MTKRIVTLSIVLFTALLSGKEVQAQSNNQKATEMTKRNIGSQLALYPMPATVIGADGIVRLSKIEVRPEYLDEYMRYAVEGGEISLRTEPGVLTMYAVGEKENPCRITILETYASQEAYRSHIASEHFQRYKQGTLHMIESLVLSDQTPLSPANKINNFFE